MEMAPNVLVQVLHSPGEILAFVLLQSREIVSEGHFGELETSACAALTKGFTIMSFKHA